MLAFTEHIPRQSYSAKVITRNVFPNIYIYIYLLFQEQVKHISLNNRHIIQAKNDNYIIDVYSIGSLNEKKYTDIYMGY